MAIPALLPCLAGLMCMSAGTEAMASASGTPLLAAGLTHLRLLPVHAGNQSASRDTKHERDRAAEAATPIKSTRRS